jgi:hypothetical protein
VQEAQKSEDFFFLSVP